MKKIIMVIISLHASLLTLHVTEAQIIHIPGDYPTIQNGIDAAYEGDTVLIDPGTYYENISFNGKNITVASLFLITQDAKYISITIIDGNQVESVVTFAGGETLLAVLCGLTLTNGGSSNSNYACGGGVYCSSASPRIENVRIINNKADWKGGGLYILSSNPVLKNVEINGNEVSGNNCPLPNDFKYGGGVYCEQSSPLFIKVDICNNFANGLGGGIYFIESNPIFSSDRRCNVYQNEAYDGRDFYSLSVFDVMLDTFTVLYPTDFYATPLNNISFDVLHGIVQQVDADFYISPSGDNSNSGLTPEEPLKNISAAFPVLRADSLHHHTLNLAEGIYSTESNGEDFPQRIIDYVNIEGVSESGVILDADSNGCVLNFSYNSSNYISNMTLTGGRAGFGGGISCDHSDPVLENMLIKGNSAYVQLQGGSSGDGGGISFRYSNPSLMNVKIINNSGGSMGGGISAFSSSLNLSDIVIKDNNAGSGGGIYLYDSDADFHHVHIVGNIANYFNSYGGGICATNSSISFDGDDRCNIYMNAACTGNEIYSDLPMEVLTDTFTVQYPAEFLVYPVTNFTFNVQNPLFAQVSADLYVSPEGDNFNSGLTQDEPLQSIHCALAKIIPDNQNPYTIHLLEGLYSHSSSAELFPLGLPDFINLRGTSPGDVILDAEKHSGVMHIANNGHNTISGITIKGGSKCGITVMQANPRLLNMNITDNYAIYAIGGCGGGFGGGIFCKYGNPELQNVTFFNNWASVKGDAAYFENSNPELVNVIASDDGIYCRTSDIEIINSTIINCCIGLDYGSVGDVVSSIFWNDMSPYSLNLGLNGIACHLYVSNSDIKNGQQGIGGSGYIHWLDGNIDDEPLFENLTEHPYQLSPDSPCIEAGATDTTGLGLPPYDILGNVRIWDGDGDGVARIDMGAYEFGAGLVAVEGPEEVQSSSASWRIKVQSYPNPFSNHTTIEFYLPEDQQVYLKIYDLTGREVSVLVNGLLASGQHIFTFEAGELQSGIYMVRLTASGQRQPVCRKIVVNKD